MFYFQEFILAEDELNEAVEKHDKLNPKIWTDEEELIPEVKAKILQIVDKFKYLLSLDNIDLKIDDIYVLGSNANFNYNEDSDLDVHIIADESFDCSEEHLATIYNCYKALFNNKYDITIKGINVELYVENKDKLSNVSSGVYSLNKGWIKKPAQYDIPDIDKTALDQAVQFWENKYYEIIENPSIKGADKYLDDIYDLRQNSIKKEGEFGLGNLTFKEIRRLGYLDDLRDLKVDLTSKELSLESLNEAKEGLTKKIRDIFKNNKNEKSKIDIFEFERTADDKDWAIAHFEDEDIDFSKLAYNKDANEENRSPVFTFAISGGLNGSGKWTDYLEDINTVFKQIENETGLEALLYEVSTDIADDVWTGFVLLYDTGKTPEDLKENFKALIEKSLKDKSTYHYNGPVYRFEHELCDEWEAETQAISFAQAFNNFLFKAKAEFGYNKTAKISLDPSCVTVDEKQVFEPSFEDTHAKCDRCGFYLDDSGTCPVCDQGDSSALEEGYRQDLFNKVLSAVNNDLTNGYKDRKFTGKLNPSKTVEQILNEFEDDRLEKALAARNATGKHLNWAGKAVSNDRPWTLLLDSVLAELVE